MKENTLLRRRRVSTAPAAVEGGGCEALILLQQRETPFGQRLLVEVK